MNIMAPPPPDGTGRGQGNVQGKELPPMADEAQTQTIRSVNWRDVFPFTHLFRAFRIAVHPSKLLLALAALLLIYLGGRVLDGAWPDRYKVSQTELQNSLLVTDTPGSAAYQAALWRDLLRGAARNDRSPSGAVDGSDGGPRRGVFITFFE